MIRDISQDGAAIQAPGSWSASTRLRRQTDKQTREVLSSTESSTCRRIQFFCISGQFLTCSFSRQASLASISQINPAVNSPGNKQRIPCPKKAACSEGSHSNCLVAQWQRTRNPEHYFQLYGEKSTKAKCWVRKLLLLQPARHP